MRINFLPLKSERLFGHLLVSWTRRDCWLRGNVGVIWPQLTSICLLPLEGTTSTLFTNGDDVDIQQVEKIDYQYFAGKKLIWCYNLKSVIETHIIFGHMNLNVLLYQDING